jgi:phosphonate metabolism protein PhnN/1,5-bisphosphokinase (PRPP-forming)
MSDSIKTGGLLFLLVGNSGSGKDTLIRCVAERWPRDCPALYAPRRYITRPPHPSEPYISVDRDAFVRMRSGGCFFLDWISYGIHYGLPADIIGYLERGAFVLANVSRDVVPIARAHYAGTRVVFIQVPYATTAKRLLGRGRETPCDAGFRDRLQRARQHPTNATADFILANNGELEAAVAGLMAFLVSQTHLAFLTIANDTGVL